MSEFDKIALITGGSRGLGQNTAESLARKGADVIVTYRSAKEEAMSIVARIQALGRKAAAMQLDLGDVSSFPAFVGEVRRTLRETWNRDSFNYLVNNAGVGLAAPFAETSEAMFDQLMAVQLKGVYFLTQALLPMLSDGGSIVNLSSDLARISVPGMSAYAMTKGGLEVLTRYLAKELGHRGITVNTVAPGATITDFGGGMLRENADMRTMIAQSTALGRVGEADDIGPAIANLLSDDSRWITGQRIEISGGGHL